MGRVKMPASAKSVWRISDEAPMGEWVDSGTVTPVRPVKKDLPEVSYGSWVTSSYDLLHGTDVIESDDTVPGELFDEFFGPQGSSAKRG